jgi:uncharacterized protein
MPPLTSTADLIVRKIRGMGRGVIAGRAFRAREIVEICPVLVLPSDSAPAGLENHVYVWDGVAGALAVALGHGSLYNHSSEANLSYTRRYARADIVFRALRDIEAGEQLFIDYGWEEQAYVAFSAPAAKK